MDLSQSGSQTAGFSEPMLEEATRGSTADKKRYLHGVSMGSPRALPRPLGAAQSGA